MNNGCRQARNLNLADGTFHIQEGKEDIVSEPIHSNIERDTDLCIFHRVPPYFPHRSRNDLN